MPFKFHTTNIGTTMHQCWDHPAPPSKDAFAGYPMNSGPQSTAVSNVSSTPKEMTPFSLLPKIGLLFILNIAIRTCRFIATYLRGRVHGSPYVLVCVHCD